MPSKTKKIVKTIVVARPKKTSRVVTTTRKVKRPRKRTGQLAVPRSVGNTALVQTYLKCMSNPFENPPIRLGFDTFVPTALHTAYYRSSLVTAADGSFDLIVLPSLINAIYFNNQGYSATPLWTAYNMANSAAIATQIDMARVVGMGLRVYPQIPLTSAPGLFSSGISPRCSLTEFVTFASMYSSAGRQGLPCNQFFLARTGNTECNQVTWRPTDTLDYTFRNMDTSPFNLSAVPGTIGIVSSATAIDQGDYDSGGSIIHMTGTGLPASTSLFIEIVMHLECTNTLNSIAADTGDDSAPKVSDDRTVGSIEQAYRFIQKYLPSVSQAIEAGTSMFGSQVSRSAQRYFNTIENRSNGFVMIE